MKDKDLEWRKKGNWCPYCKGSLYAGYDMTKSVEERLYFICRKCGKKVLPENVGKEVKK